MKIIYVGRHRAVEIDSVGVTVCQGETVDLPTELANSLLTQKGQWRKAPRPRDEPAEPTTKETD